MFFPVTTVNEDRRRRPSDSVAAATVPVTDSDCYWAVSPSAAAAAAGMQTLPRPPVTITIMMPGPAGSSDRRCQPECRGGRLPRLLGRDSEMIVSKKKSQSNLGRARALFYPATAALRRRPPGLAALPVATDRSTELESAAARRRARAAAIVKSLDWTRKS